MSRSPGLLLALASLAACAPAAPAPPGPPAPVTVATTARPAAPTAAVTASARREAPVTVARTPAAEAACQALVTASGRVLDRALLASEELRGDPLPDLRSSARGCLGATPWGVQLDDVAPAPCGPDGCAWVRWRLAFVAADGSTRLAAPERDRVGRQGLRLLAVDPAEGPAGGAWALVRRADAFVACGREALVADERSDVWKVSADQLVPHEAARRVAGGLGLRSARDVDGDGRVDLVTEGPYRAVVALACGGPDVAALLEGPELLAHALADGSFALDDAVAMAHQRRVCPGRPSSIVLASPKPALVLGAASRNVACARMLGASTDEVVRELTAARAQLCPGSGGGCDALTELTRWATLPPPVRW